MVLDFQLSVGFGSVLEEKPRFRFRFQFSSPCVLVNQSAKRCAIRRAMHVTFVGTEALIRPTHKAMTSAGRPSPLSPHAGQTAVTARV